jgi:hypothetical protein
MSRDESSPSSDIRESNPEPRPRPRAWQPLTPRGVAAFAGARIGRLLLVQFIVALLVAGSVIWFLATTWFPSVREAIRQLPDTGLVENQRLDSPHASTTPLVENKFLDFVVNTEGAAAPSRTSDLRVEFRRRNFSVCSLFGCLNLEYPPGQAIQFNRPELESRWAAWELTLYSAAGIGTVAWLFASWLLLATVYSPVARLYAFFKDRRLTLLGGWKLASAALMPGALFAAAGIVLYGLGVIDLIRFLLLWVLHFFVGWVYLFLGPLSLPRASDAAPVKANPFGTPKPADPNPFSKESRQGRRIK